MISAFGMVAQGKRNQWTMDDLYRPLEQPEPLRLQVHQALEQLIVNGHLAPGLRLVETELAERLGVSRGPIREALQMLAREGWVELRPRQGTYVAKPTLDELIDYFDVRALLEIETARLAARSVSGDRTPEQESLLTDLEDVVIRSTKYAQRIEQEGADLDPAFAEDARRFHREGSQHFHQGVAKLAGNAALVDLLARLSKRTRWYFSPRILERTVRAWEEHEALRAAIAKGDEEEAASVMTEHMHSTRQTFLKAHSNS